MNSGGMAVQRLQRHTNSTTAHVDRPDVKAQIWRAWRLAVARASPPLMMCDNQHPSENSPRTWSPEDRVY